MELSRDRGTPLGPFLRFAMIAQEQTMVTESGFEVHARNIFGNDYPPGIGQGDRYRPGSLYGNARANARRPGRELLATAPGGTGRVASGDAPRR